MEVRRATPPAPHRPPRSAHAPAPPRPPHHGAPPPSRRAARPGESDCERSHRSRWRHPRAKGCQSRGARRPVHFFSDRATAAGGSDLPVVIAPAAVLPVRPRHSHGPGASTSIPRHRPADGQTRGRGPCVRETRAAPPVLPPRSHPGAAPASLRSRTKRRVPRTLDDRTPHPRAKPLPATGDRNASRAATVAGGASAPTGATATTPSRPHRKNPRPKRSAAPSPRPRPGPGPAAALSGSPGPAPPRPLASRSACHA